MYFNTDEERQQMLLDAFELDDGNTGLHPNVMEYYRSYVRVLDHERMGYLIALVEHAKQAAVAKSRGTGKPGAA